MKSASDWFHYTDGNNNLWRYNWDRFYLVNFYFFINCISNLYGKLGGTRWRSWLRHCATSRKIAGASPFGVIGIFHWSNPSSSSMSLGLTQPVPEMIIRNISWGEGQSRTVRRADNFTIFIGRLSWNVGVSAFWNHRGLSMPVMGLRYF
jgi:hypothetical protein